MERLECSNTSYKILVLGDSNVGKTCLIHRYCDRQFSENYISTIGIDCKQKSINIKNQAVTIKIWDTAGQERFRTLTSAYYRGAHGIVLVYDITREDTFDQLTYWTKNISKMASPDICKILVGNKSDLSSVRKVKVEKAKQFATSFSIPYIETSCKMDTNVDEVFTILANDISEIQDRTKEDNRISLHERSLQHHSPEKKSSSCAC